MKEIPFSDAFIKKITSLKTPKYKDELFKNLRRLNEYMREDEYPEVYGAIEEMVEIKSTGNIITGHGFGTFSEWQWKEPSTFIKTMIEDLWGWFMFETEPLKCRIFCMGIHIDDYEFTAEDLYGLKISIMINFIEKGIPCPNVVLIPTLDYKKKMENGYFILGLK